LGGTIYLQEYSTIFLTVPISTILMFIAVWAD
jgi:hypothetical protein